MTLEINHETVNLSSSSLRARRCARNRICARHGARRRFDAARRGLMASEARAQELMTTMQAQMNKLRETADPEQRQKLMQEHTATMQQAMKSMRTHGQTMGMMGGGMMGGGMMGGGPAGRQPDEARGSPDEHARMMEQCMSMMHQVMQHEGMTQRN
jgi:hypothetical protein